MQMYLAIEATQLLLCIGSLIAFAEAWYNRFVTGANGYLAWRVTTGLSIHLKSKLLYRLLSLSASGNVLCSLFAAQAMILLLLVTGISDYPIFLSAVLVLLQLVLNYRLRPVLNAAMQMRLMLFIGLFFFYSTHDEQVRLFALIFICFQVLLSYLLPGFLKSGSLSWRSGTTLRFILAAVSKQNGEGRLSHLKKKAALLQVAAIAVLLFECLMPFAVFLGIKPTLLFLSFGLLFHLSNAFIFGYNDFLIVYLAGYPSVLFCASWLDSLSFTSR